jgi:hypothetical protein
MIFASFDLDGTLVNSLDLIYSALASSGYIVDANNHNKFHFKFKEGLAPPPDFQWELFFYRLFTERHDEILPVDRHVAEFMSTVYASGNEPIRVITSRPNGVLMHWSTCALLNRLFPDMTFSVDIVGSGSVKGKYTFGTDIFFEDRRKTVRELANQDNIVFMRRDSYNNLERTEYIAIQDVFPLDLTAGNIVVYDDFGQLLEADIVRLLAPNFSY